MDKKLLQRFNGINNENVNNYFTPPFFAFYFRSLFCIMINESTRTLTGTFILLMHLYVLSLVLKYYNTDYGLDDYS